MLCDSVDKNFQPHFVIGIGDLIAKANITNIIAF